jgi:hypothetical protein
MARRWEREGLNTSRAERYELLYARALGIRPEELGSGQEGADYQPHPPIRTNQIQS